MPINMQGLLDVLGGSRDDVAEPIVGKEGLKSAKMNALLSLGTAMLAKSGYSTMPVSGGEALGAGLQAAQQGYGESIDRSMQVAQQAQLMKQRDAEMQRKRMLMQMAGQMTGMQVPGGGPAPGGAPAGAGGPPPGAGPMGAPPPQGNPMTQGLPQMPEPAAAAVAGSEPTFTRQQAMAMTLLDPERAAAYQNIYDMSNPELKPMPDGTMVNPRDPSLAGKQFAQLDNGMVRGPDGQVSLAPGYAEAAGQLAMQKAYADKSQDLVDVVIPGQGVVKVPRGAMGTSITMGPNGQPVATLGGPQGFLSQEDPAALEERKGNVATFLKAKEEAISGSRAASEELNSLDNVANLLAEAKPGLGQTAQFQLGRVLDATGLAKGDQSKWVANAAAFQMAQKTAGLSVLKSTFGGNPTEGERKILLESLGNLDTPQEAVQMRVDIARIAAERKQAYAQFLQEYDGNRAQFEKAWRQSGEGSKTTFDYPSMWKHLPVMRGKAGTPAAGKTFVRTPRGAIYPVQIGPDGTPQPIGE